MLEEYETFYRIFDHDDPAYAERPLRSMAMHPKENVQAYSEYNRAVWRFHALRMGEMTNMNVWEFLNQTREQVNLMYEIAEALAAEKSHEAGNIENELQKALRR